MSARLRVLITGFGPFPGAPYNPTPALVSRLLRLRRPAFAEIERVGHIFEVSYHAVDRDLPRLLAEHRPDVLLMFGLAARTRHLRVETRVRNAVTGLWPDAGGVVLGRFSIAGGQDDRAFDSMQSTRLLSVARATGIDARRSRDAGRYLCNYLCWRALERLAFAGAPRLAAFIHVPAVARPGTRERRIGAITADQLVDAAEAILLELVRMARSLGTKDSIAAGHADGLKARGRNV